jgi:hypothetical protein
MALGTLEQQILIRHKTFNYKENINKFDYILFIKVNIKEVKRQG